MPAKRFAHGRSAQWLAASSANGLSEKVGVGYPCPVRPTAPGGTATVSGAPRFANWIVTLVCVAREHHDLPCRFGPLLDTTSERGKCATSNLGAPGAGRRPALLTRAGSPGVVPETDSLLALPLVKAPAAASLAAGAAAIALPYFVHSSRFDPPGLLWLGLAEVEPNTVDWRPLLPWAGVVLVGLGLARLPGALQRLTSASRWRAKAAPNRFLCFAGRHSLAIYLVHQPILIGLVAAVSASGLLATFPPPKPDFSGFLAACKQTCVARGRATEDCESACQCVADTNERSGEADRLGQLDRKREAELKRMADACMGRQ